MHRLFIKPLFDTGKVDIPNLDRLRSLINQQVEYQQSFYKMYGTYVPSNHLLVRLCYLLSAYLDIEANIERRVIENATEICTALQITSSNYKGRLFNKAFYTNKCLVLSASFISSSEVVDWMSIRPVRCLTHPFVDMEVKLPTLKSSLLKDGISAVGIDLVLFAKMFYGWNIENEAKPRVEQESITHFLSKYVLTGMINEQMDIAVRNRINLLALGKEIPIGDERPFIRGYEKAIDAMILKSMKFIRTRNAVYKFDLQQLPMLHANNFLDAIPIEIGGLFLYSY